MDALDRLIERLGPATIYDALSPMLSPERVARIDAVLAMRLTSLATVVEDLYDPFNGAAAIRSTEALGLQEFHAIEPGIRFHAAKGITRGCHRWLDVHRWTSAPDAITSLRGRGFRVYATAPDAPVDVETVDVGTPVAVVFGNEHSGVTDAAIAACDGTVKIGMFGFTESFNLSVSVALAMSRLAARRRAHLGAPGDLTDERRAHLRARWFGLRIRGAIGVIERHVSERTRTDVAARTQPGENGAP